MKTIFTTALLATFSFTAHAKDDRTSLKDIQEAVGSQKFINVERLYQGEGKYQVLVTTSLPGKKGRDVGGLEVLDNKQGDYFTVVETLCNPATVIPGPHDSDRLSFHCFTK